jgi:hypothetical protein
VPSRARVPTGMSPLKQVVDTDLTGSWHPGRLLKLGRITRPGAVYAHNRMDHSAMKRLNRKGRLTVQQHSSAVGWPSDLENDDGKARPFSLFWRSLAEPPSTKSRPTMGGFSRSSPRSDYSMTSTIRWVLGSTSTVRSLTMVYR